MGLYTKALINQVVCEETVTLTRLDQDVPIGNIPVPRGSEISGQTSISVLDCIPLLKDGRLGLQISLFVQEELYLTTPQGAYFPLEFGFRFQDFAPLANCEYAVALEDIFAELDCLIISLSGSNQLTLHDDRTFDQFLEIMIQVRLIQESQIQIALCPPYSIPRGEVSSEMELGIVGGLLLAAFFLGTRQNKLSPNKADPPSAPTLRKRRVPTSGLTIPTV